MSVVSPFFFVLLAAMVLLLRIVPQRGRGVVLLAGSAIFYFSGNVLSAALGVAILAINFLFFRALRAASRETARERIYFASVACNLALFVVLKLVFEGAVGNMASGWSLGGYHLGYPLGLSFILLMLHAALTDVYNEVHASRAGPQTFFLYGLFFPYVTSGPVERLNHMEGQLEAPRQPGLVDLRQGAVLIAFGLFKKLVVANRLGPYVTDIFEGKNAYSSTTLLIAIALNAVHMYADFGGYTDIARGAARTLGMDIRINFDRPFASRSVTEYWRRWHISFSSWLREYLYLPMAYMLSRRTRLAPLISIFLTFVIAGFWHRAAWTFVLFGLLHGLVLALELRFGRPISKDDPVWKQRLLSTAARTYTLAFIAFALILFSAANVPQALAIVGRLLSSPVLPWTAELFGYRGPFIFLLMAMSLAFWQLLARWQEDISDRTAPVFIVLCLALLLFLGTEGSEFIYVQF